MWFALCMERVFFRWDIVLIFAKNCWYNFFSPGWGVSCAQFGAHCGIGGHCGICHMHVFSVHCARDGHYHLGLKWVLFIQKDVWSHHGNVAMIGVATHDRVCVCNSELCLRKWSFLLLCHQLITYALMVGWVRFLGHQMAFFSLCR